MGHPVDGEMKMGHPVDREMIMGHPVCGYTIHISHKLCYFAKETTQEIAARDAV